RTTTGVLASTLRICRQSSTPEGSGSHSSNRYRSKTADRMSWRPAAKECAKARFSRGNVICNTLHASESSSTQSTWFRGFSGKAGHLLRFRSEPNEAVWQKEVSHVDYARSI